MNDIVNIETIPTAIIGNLSRKEIKDKAADMVVGLDSDDIKSYNPESSRKNRILNRVYNRYNKKYNDEKFVNLSLREINKLPTKEQERWFALNKSKTAGPVLGGIAALTMPTILGPLVEAPMLTLASLAGSTIGGKTGQYVGEAFDRNNHGYTNYSDVFTMLGGAVGGLSPIAINKGLNNIVTTWNSGKQHKSDYSNWGGEFINDLPMSKRFQTTRGPIDSSLHPNISRSQRELWTMQDLYGAALKTGDRKLIGDTADALNRQHRKYVTETGHAKLTDAELVEQFNNLRAIASHNRQNGNDYLTYTRKALKLVPELNRRGITKSYFPTHDDLTYTLVTDAERYKYLADKFGGTAMKNAADNNISAYDYNISQSRKFRKLFDSEFGGYMRPMGIGNRTYSGINLSNKTIVSNKPSKTAFYNTGSQMQNAKQAIYNGGMDMYRFMESDVYKNSVPRHCFG